MTFTTELTIDDHKDFFRMLGTRLSERAVRMVSYLLILAVFPFLVYSVALFAFSLAESWQKPRFDEIISESVFLGSVAVGVLLLPLAFLWIRWASRFLARRPMIDKLDSIDESALRAGLNLGPIEFEAGSDGLRVAMALDKERRRDRPTVAAAVVLDFGVPCTLIIVPRLIGIFDEIRQGLVPEGFGFAWVVGVVFAICFLGYEAWLIWDWLRTRFGVGKPGWIGREGVHWGQHRITASDGTLVVERAKCRTTYRWPAILGIEESRYALFLMLTRRSAVVVPKSAFASRAQARSFCDFVNSRLAAALST